MNAICHNHNLSTSKKKKKNQKTASACVIGPSAFLHLHSLAALLLCECWLAKETGSQRERQQD